MTAYKTVARTAAAFAAALVFALAAAAAAEPAATLGNADIVSMTRANVAPTLIINRIQASPNNFDLSDTAFMELKANGVADEVLSAMLAASRPDGSGGAAASAVSAANAPGMQLPALPAIGGNDWSDFGADLANLPPPPALPAFSAPAGAGGAAGLPALPAMPSLDMPAAAPAATSAPAVGGVPQLPAFSAAPVAPAASAPAFSALPAAPAADPFAFAQTVPVAPSAPSAPAFAQAFSAPPVAAAPVSAPAASPLAAPAAPVAAGFDAVRFESELVNIINGSAPAQRAGMAWMLANQQQTLPGLRQALAAASRPEMQAGAVQVLGELNDQSSLPFIRDLLGSPSPLVRKESAKALARMNDAVAVAAAEQSLDKPVDPLDGLIHLVGYARLVRASDRLGAILSRNPSAVNRAAAAAALAEIGRGGAAAWPALESALANDADANVRREAARAVARFHDPSSAPLLMSACRRDPEVRKVALEAMADYPEAVEFLVGVVGLGADQIAPDESETARASLAKLTGQDFGTDGPRWAAWFAQNKSLFSPGGAGASVLAAAPAAPTAPAGVSGLSGVGASSGSSLPPPVSAPPATGPVAPGQVDITALGMLVDPSQIPMALELEQRQAAAFGDGLLRVPGAGGAGGAPGALSANDFGAGAAAGAAAGPGLLGGAAGAGAVAGPGAAGGAGPQSLPTPAGFEEYGNDQMWGGSMPAGGAVSGMDMGGFGGDSSGMLSGSSSGMSSLPRQPVVSPAPGAPVDAGSGSGLRLALPPMTGGDLGGGEFGGTATVPMSDSSAFGDFSSSGDFAAQPEYPAQTDFSSSSDFPAPSDYAAQGDFADTQPYDPAAVPADAVPYDETEWEQYMDPMDPSAGYAAEGDPAGQGDSFADPYADASADDFGGVALPPPPGSGDSPDTIAFPGDTDAFGLGDPMFPDDGTGGFVGDEYADYDASGMDGGAQLAMPPLPGSGASGGTGALAPRGPDILENYSYGEYNDGLSDADADFAVDDFEAFLREADEAATAHADTLPDGTEAPPASLEGTAEWASGIHLPPIGEPYTIESGNPSARGGAPVMELVRGVGLVEREAPAPAAPAVVQSDPSLPEPELIVPEPLSGGASVEEEPAPAAPREDSGGWYYVDDGTPDVPIIAEDVYEVPAEEEVLPASPSGGPSRTLRMQR